MTGYDDAVTASPRLTVVADTLNCVACGNPSSGHHCENCGALIKAGHYQVTQVVRQTDHGGTYLAQEPGSLQLVLQEIRPTEKPTEKVISEFEREAQLLLDLKHPKVPKFLEIFREGEGADMRFYRVQQYVEGEAISLQVIRFPFEESRLRDIARQVLELLDLIHGPGFRVVHGDIKASTLILDNDGMLWLVGWGSTFLLPDPNDREANKDRTPPPPGRVNHPSGDIYAVGAMLVHMLLRKDPSALLKPGVRPPLEENLQASPEMIALLDRLVGEPAYSRIDSAREATRQLRSVHLKKKRRGPPLWAVGLIILGLVGGAALYVYLRAF